MVVEWWWNDGGMVVELSPFALVNIQQRFNNYSTTIQQMFNYCSITVHLSTPPFFHPFPSLP
jgi:hypothetical protein